MNIGSWTIPVPLVLPSRNMNLDLKATISKAVQSEREGSMGLGWMGLPGAYVLGIKHEPELDDGAIPGPQSLLIHLFDAGRLSDRVAMDHSLVTNLRHPTHERSE